GELGAQGHVARQKASGDRRQLEDEQDGPGGGGFGGGAARRFGRTARASGDRSGPGLSRAAGGCQGAGGVGSPARGAKLPLGAVGRFHRGRFSAHAAGGGGAPRSFWAPGTPPRLRGEGPDGRTAGPRRGG